MSRQLTWCLLVPVFYNVANWMVATGWTQSTDVAAALSDFNANLPPDKQFAVSVALAQSQKEFSRTLDEAAFGKATLYSEAGPGARRVPLLCALWPHADGTIGIHR